MSIDRNSKEQIEKDLHFISEMKERSVRISEGQHDISEIDYLKCMINDWYDELNELNKGTPPLREDN